MDCNSFQFQPPRPLHHHPSIPNDLIDLPPFHFSPSDFAEQLKQMMEDPPHPSSSTADSTNSGFLLEVITTERGKPSIIYDNNVFQERSNLKDRISYRCSLYHTRNGSCPATLKTDKQRSLVLETTGTHNHPDRSPNTLEKKRKMHQIKQTYTADPSRPIRVIAEELGVVPTVSLRMKHSRLRKRTTSSQQ